MDCKNTCPFSNGNYSEVAYYSDNGEVLYAFFTSKHAARSFFYDLYWTGIKAELVENSLNADKN